MICHVDKFTVNVRNYSNNTLSDSVATGSGESTASIGEYLEMLYTHR